MDGPSKMDSFDLKLGIDSGPKSVEPKICAPWKKGLELGMFLFRFDF